MSDTALRDQVNGFYDDTVALRRRIHRQPELGNDLPRTREAVLEAIDDLPLYVTLHETTSGISCLLDGDAPGPTILLRADMDALPLHEDTGLEFSSDDDGTMHACGHDTHTAMLVAAARLLSERRGELAGRVLFMFQPGEEGHHGAKFMLDEGLLTVPPRADGSASPVAAAFALHITSALPSGYFATRPGPVMASADRLLITLTGKGGHASEPHRAIDPIPVACEIVQALQTMVTRSIDVFDPGVVTVGRITAGTTNNIIPETAEIEGTIRAVSEATRRKIHDGVRRVVDGVAAAHGVSGIAEIEAGYGVTVNDDGVAERSSRIVTDLVGSERVVRLANPVMGAEDFSYVLDEVPGTMMFLGGTPSSTHLATAPPNHSNRVMFDEAAMRDGVAAYAAFALDHLTS